MYTRLVRMLSTVMGKGRHDNRAVTQSTVSLVHLHLHWVRISENAEMLTGQGMYSMCINDQYF